MCEVYNFSGAEGARAAFFHTNTWFVYILESGSFTDACFQPAFLLTKTWQLSEPNGFPSFCFQGVVIIICQTQGTPNTIISYQARLV